MQKLFYYLIFCFQTLVGFSQVTSQISGKILSENLPVQGVKIINLNTEQNTISNNNGEFIILAKAEDLLVFYAPDFEYKRRLLSEKDISANNILINLSKKPIELKEVIIEKPKITAANLGIVPANQKSYTPAERRLQEAGNLTPQMLITGLLGFNLPLNPIINAITGRTKKLKKELKIEQYELRLEKIKNLYENTYYTNTLKIPIDYIPAFQYFTIYDENLEACLKAKNNTKIAFRMTELATEFNQLLANANN